MELKGVTVRSDYLDSTNHGNKNNKNNTKRVARKKTTNKKVGNNNKPAVVISACAKDYALAQEDPAALLRTGRYPCVPDAICFPSGKFAIVCEVDAETTAAGNFSVPVYTNKPYGGASGMVSYTTTFSTWSAASPPGSASVPSWGAFQSPIASSERGAGTARYRCVASALYFVPTEAEFTRKGSMYCWQSTTGTTDIVTGNDLRTMNGTVVLSVTGDSACIARWMPSSITDLAYVDKQTATNHIDAPTYGLFGTGCSASTTVGRVRIVAFYEYVSTNAPHGTSTSHADPVGHGAVVETNVVPGGRMRDAVNHERRFAAVARAIANTASYVTSSAAQAGLRMATHALMNAGPLALT